MLTVEQLLDVLPHKIEQLIYHPRGLTVVVINISHTWNEALIGQLVKAQEDLGVTFRLVGGDGEDMMTRSSSFTAVP